MSIDMSQFHGVFLEESAEHLDEMERLLMELDLQQPDKEQLNSIFRAAHSIKGGAGIFGFDALILVTHVMESLFDRVRQGQYWLTAAIIDQLLQVIDLLRQLLHDYGAKQQPDWNGARLAAGQIEALLQTPEQREQETLQGFGLFDTAPPVEDAEGFGFFEPLDGVEDQGFGLFLSQPTETEPLGLETDEAESEPLAPAPDLKTESLTGSDPEWQPESKKAKADPEASSVRVDISKIDSLVNLVGELVITQSMLTALGREFEGGQSERLLSALAELERNTRDIQEGIMAIRMLPLSFVFNRFPRVVRDLSHKLDKQVQFEIEGGQTEIDKSLIEKLVDPLTHLVRNSLDHGIEPPEVRRQAGKPARGLLKLIAEQKGSHILICVSDDGRGLNREKIIAKARQQGIVIADTATDIEVWQLIMAPGFSTAEQVTDLSGRGVGMDVVQRNIEAMAGKLDIESQPGLGTQMRIRLPLTLSIVDGMSVAVGAQQFILPLVNIVESMQPQAEHLQWISNRQVLYRRDTYWPIIELYQVLDQVPKYRQPTQAVLVLIETSKQRFALLVDELLGQQQVVVKNLEQHYRRVAGVAGATIMGDGSVALILDAESMAQLLPA